MLNLFYIANLFINGPIERSKFYTRDGEDGSNIFGGVLVISTGAEEVEIRFVNSLSSVSSECGMIDGREIFDTGNVVAGIAAFGMIVSETLTLEGFINSSCRS